MRQQHERERHGRRNRAADAKNVYYCNAGRGLVLAGSMLYWPADAGGWIMSLPVTGGMATKMIMGQGSPRDIVGDSTTLFWSNYQTGGIASATLPNGSSPNRIYKVGLSGGASMAAPEHSAVFEILTDATNLYWIAGDMIKGASLKKIPKP